ncbi:hypothetical protein ACUH7Y_09440 [Clostridium beijerinckii]|uniref:Uncharacterized protein n=1 Tax=Clostridium beijerinckii TaxID=1520 RepID=A0A7X9SMC3_CLOBE|nr:hypothetical protein [Clostridium beijerinckii]NMF04536.1 hypothetical protein [Clostridium beijerinckii]
MIRKLIIKFKDGSKVTYTIRKNYVDPMQYFNRHTASTMESAILQIYPKMYNPPIDFLALIQSKETQRLVQEDETGMLTINSALRKVKESFSGKEKEK